MEKSRRRRGCDVDIPWRSRGAAAAATWIFRGERASQHRYPSDHFGAVATIEAGAAAAAPVAAAAAPAPAKKRPSTAAAFFQPRKKAAAAASTAPRARYRGAPVPAGWQLVDDALLVARVGGPSGASAPPGGSSGASARPRRLAAFDFDDTLSPLDWGRPAAWSHLYPHAPAVVRKLAGAGAAIAVLSNECRGRRGFPSRVARGRVAGAGVATTPPRPARGPGRGRGVATPPRARGRFVGAAAGSSPRAVSRRPRPLQVARRAREEAAR